MHPTPSAVLFDLDDTLLEDGAHAARCWAEASAAVAEASGIDGAALAAAIDESRRRFWSDPVRHARERVNMLSAWGKVAAGALDAIGRPSPAIAAAMASDFAARRRSAQRLFPDTLPCLAALRSRGVAVALVTNGDALVQRDKLARFDLAHHFDAILIEGEFGTGKPDEAVYRHVLAAVGVAAENACMVGDNLEWDVLGPQRLGIHGVWIDRLGAGLPAGSPRPAEIIRSLDQLSTR
jgi:putative hydrolase of the HAD superfamily